MSEARTHRYCYRWSRIIRISVFVRDVFNKKHEEDIVLVLAGIHAAAQLIAGLPEEE